MDAITENNIRQEQIESFGRMMAGFSHDMKNHLGIIRESNGLISDLIEMGALGDDETMTQRFNKTISSIEQRVVIAANMLHHLGRLPHRSDTSFSVFNINDLTQEICTFLERFSRLKQVNMVMELGEGFTTVYNDPSLLQHIIFRVYVECLEQLSPGDSLIIITGQNDKNTEIIFRLIGNSHISVENLFDTNINLLEAIKKLEATVKTSENIKDSADITLALHSLADE